MARFIISASPLSDEPVAVTQPCDKTGLETPATKKGLARNALSLCGMSFEKGILLFLLR